MATLSRPRISSILLPSDSSETNTSTTRAKTDPNITHNVPKPFPTREEREQQDLLDSLENEELLLDVDADSDLPPAKPLVPQILHSQLSSVPQHPCDSDVVNGPKAQAVVPTETDDSSARHRSEELFPSIVHVQTSCLMTLNDLLFTSLSSPSTPSSAAAQWQPILPDRRHSMPPPRSPATSTYLVPPTITTSSSSGPAFSSITANPPLTATSTTSTGVATSPAASALFTLVSNLRARDIEANDEIIEIAREEDEGGLLGELKLRVDRLASSSVHPRSSTSASSMNLDNPFLDPSETSAAATSASTTAMEVPLLSSQDAELAQTLVSLLAHFHRLSRLYPSSGKGLNPPRVSSWNHQELPLADSGFANSKDAYTTLRRQLSDFQLERSNQVSSSSSLPFALHTQHSERARQAVVEVESALLWGRIDEELETVLGLCRLKGQQRHHHQQERQLEDHRPPEYGPVDYRYACETYAVEEDEDELPEYEPGDYEYGLDKDKDKFTSKHLDTSLHSPGASTSTRMGSSSTMAASNEKMKMDLERVTLAIDRLYLVAPQLHNQRVELKKTKVEEMERARREGSPLGSTSSGKHMHRDQQYSTEKQKQKAVDRDVRDLEHMLKMIDKASERKLVDQSVVVSKEDFRDRIERARVRDQKKREEFVGHLIEHSNAGRLSSQDAIYSPPLPSTAPLSRSRSHPHDASASTSTPMSMSTSTSSLSTSTTSSSSASGSASRSFSFSTSRSGSTSMSTTLSQGQTKVEDPNALLSLPEFIRESISSPLSHSHSRLHSVVLDSDADLDLDTADAEREREDLTLLTLPEFVKEPIPDRLRSSHSSRSRRPSAHTHSYSYSLSAPRSRGSSEDAIRDDDDREREKGKGKEKEKGRLSPPRFGTSSPKKLGSPRKGSPASAGIHPTSTNDSLVSLESSAGKDKGKKNRNRSLSAPPLAWLFSSGSRNNHAHTNGSTSSLNGGQGGSFVVERKKRGAVGGAAGSLLAGLDVTYVAEHHENLHHVLVFLTVSGMRSGFNLEAEVLPFDSYSSPTLPPASSSREAQKDRERMMRGREKLYLKCGTSTSRPLDLPARVEPGKKEVSVVGGRHYEIKLPSVSTGSGGGLNAASAYSSSSEDSLPYSTSSSSSSTHHHQHQHQHQYPTNTPTILDATYLSATLPTSLICSSCSLPIVQSTKLTSYRDLPSEHWAELVDAWVCHSDMKMNVDVQRRSKEGFWPGERKALVGGSYVLVREEVVVGGNLCEGVEKKHADDWYTVRCICGAVIGRRQEHTPEGADQSVMVYRLAKYAFRPVIPGSEPRKIPLSSFIVEDMNEFVQAHATYRFVIVDEEQDRPRILVWLFKPNIRIAYTTPSQYLLPKSGSIRAAKVLFKVLTPATDIQATLNKYPGFPQAEHLSYPIDICRRLAGLLKESNTAYPESMRTMTGLDVGWLQRV